MMIRKFVADGRISEYQRTIKFKELRYYRSEANRIASCSHFSRASPALSLSFSINGGDGGVEFVSEALKFPPLQRTSGCVINGAVKVKFSVIKVHSVTIRDTGCIVSGCLRVSGFGSLLSFKCCKQKQPFYNGSRVARLLSYYSGNRDGSQAKQEFAEMTSMRSGVKASEFTFTSMSL